MSWTRTQIRLAADLDALSRAEIDRLQADNLAALVDAAAATPAVCARWPDVPRVRHRADLALLPLMSPADLAELGPPHTTDLLLDGVRAGLVLRTSGSTGRRKVLYHSWLFNRQVGLLGARGVRRALAPPPDRLANCLSPGGLNGAYQFAHDIGELLPALTFSMGTVLQPAELAEILAEHAVDTMMASPAWAVDLLTGAPEEFAGLKALLYIGGPLGARRHQALTGAVPGLVVRSLAYSTSETGPIGYQCPAAPGAAHHVHEDAVIVEVLDETTGEPVPDGELGEVVVTALSDTGMALFRYRVGDRGRWHPQPCRCGSAARLLVLTGRVGESITVDTTTVTGDLLADRLAGLGLDSMQDCQFQVLWAGAKFQVRLLLSPWAPLLTTETVARHFHAEYQMDRILTNPQCAGFTVRHVAASEFARTDRGKVPLFYEQQ